MVIRNVNALLHEIKFQFDRFDQTLNGIKMKFYESSDHLGTLASKFKEEIKSACRK